MSCTRYRLVSIQQNFRPEFFQGIRWRYELPRARTSWQDVEYTGRPLSADAVARPASESSEVRVSGRGVLQHANEPVILSPGVRYRQDVAARPIVRPREPHHVLRRSVHLASQRQRLVTTRRDLASLVAHPAPRRIFRNISLR